MNRDDFQALARIRLEEANALLQASYYDGAYYLAGYAVECGLKACIAKLTRRFDFPPDRDSINDMYTHDLTKLLKAANLTSALDQELRSDPAFEVNWTIVKQWSEVKRYERIRATDARDLVNAIKDQRHGVLRWLRRHW